MLAITLRKNMQSAPLQRDFKPFTAEFHPETTDRANWCDVSSDTWKLDTGTLSNL